MSTVDERVLPDQLLAHSACNDVPPSAHERQRGGRWDVSIGPASADPSNVIHALLGSGSRPSRRCRSALKSVRRYGASGSTREGTRWRHSCRGDTGCAGWLSWLTSMGTVEMSRKTGSNEGRETWMSDRSRGMRRPLMG